MSGEEGIAVDLNLSSIRFASYVEDSFEWHISNQGMSAISNKKIKEFLALNEGKLPPELEYFNENVLRKELYPSQILLALCTKEFNCSILEEKDEDKNERYNIKYYFYITALIDLTTSSYSIYKISLRKAIHTIQGEISPESLDFIHPSYQDFAPFHEIVLETFPLFNTQGMVDFTNRSDFQMHFAENDLIKSVAACRENSLARLIYPPNHQMQLKELASIYKRENQIPALSNYLIECIGDGLFSFLDIFTLSREQMKLAALIIEKKKDEDKLDFYRKQELEKLIKIHYAYELAKISLKVFQDYIERELPLALVRDMARLQEAYGGISLEEAYKFLSED